MANSITFEEVAALAAQLSTDDRLRLAQYLLQAGGEKPTAPRRKWSEIQGMVPYPLCGEDAQRWVSRSRQEDDEHRDRGLAGGRS